MRRRSKGGNGAAINMAPLIDMVFILLIFFMVTSTFVRDVGIEVERPRATYSEVLDSRSLRVNVTMNGAIWVDGRRVDLSELRGRVARFVRRGESASLIIVPDRKAEAGRLVEVMDAAKLGGARNIAVATRRRDS